MNQKPGFPQDDEISIQAGCCGNFACDCNANLDIFYGAYFIQNERWTCGNLGCEYICLEHTPVVSGTLTGSVKFKGSSIASFLASATGKITVDVGEGIWRNNDRPLTPIGGTLNQMTGQVSFDWGGNTPKRADYEYVFSYEYSRENTFSIETNTLLLFEDSPYLFEVGKLVEPVGNFIHFGEFSPMRRSAQGYEAEKVLIHYRILCRNASAEKLAYVIQKLNMVDAYYSIYDVSVPKGCQGIGAFGSPELKFLMGNDPRKEKPNYVNHAREHKEFLDRCSATDS